MMAQLQKADYTEVFDWLMQQSQLGQLDAERVALVDASGRILAVEVCSLMAEPRQRLSAMDGYGFTQETPKVKPEVNLAFDNLDSDQAWLEVVGCQMAGQPPMAALAANQAVRVMTGACLPAGVNCVIPLEYAELKKVNDQAWLRRPIQPLIKSNIKEVGCELVQGELVLHAGQKLGAVEMALLASMGIGFVEVWAMPKVVVLLSGDELVPLSDSPTQALQSGQRYETNSWWLRSLLSAFSIEWVAMQQVSDDPGAMGDALAFWQSRVDLILTVGGASVGDKDGVTQALSSMAAPIVVKRWQLQMRPAKPLSYVCWPSAHDPAIAACHLLALPGNPLAGFMSFKLFVNAFLAKMCRATHWQAHSQQVQMAHAYAGHDSLTLWLQVKRTSAGVVVLEAPSSGHLKTLLQADGYMALLPKQRVLVGDWVTLWTYS